MQAGRTRNAGGESRSRSQRITLAPQQGDLSGAAQKRALLAPRWSCSLEGRPTVISRLVRNLSSSGQSERSDKVPYLAGAFIPASGLPRDREWRFWADANDSERRWIQPVAVLHRTTTADRTVTYAQADHSVTAGVRQQRPAVTLGTRHVIGRPVTRPTLHRLRQRCLPFFGC
ncbi:hypothetical protein F01_560017 [Burkholderia cenocepacia]|nr:hypothetical protein F01_560017 [Burkholderia cenocepacia]